MLALPLACVAVAAIFALLLERTAKRQETLVERLVAEIVAVREDALVERASLLNRLAAPQVLQQVTPTGVIARAVAEQRPPAPIGDPREDDDEELNLTGAILPEVAE